MIAKALNTFSLPDQLPIAFLKILMLLWLITRASGADPIKII